MPSSGGGGGLGLRLLRRRLRLRRWRRRRIGRLRPLDRDLDRLFLAAGWSARAPPATTAPAPPRRAAATASASASGRHAAGGGRGNAGDVVHEQEAASRPPPVRCRRWWCGASRDARSGSCGVTACTVQRLSHISTSCGSQTWRYMYCGWAANSDSSSISRMRRLLVEALDRIVVDRADVERLAAAHRMAAHHRMPHRRHRGLLGLGRRRRAGDPVQHAEVVPRLAALDLAAQRRRAGPRRPCTC